MESNLYFFVGIIVLLVLAIFYLITENHRLKKENEDYPLARTLATDIYVSYLIGAKYRLTDLLNGDKEDFANKSDCNELLQEIENFLKRNYSILSLKEVKRIADNILEREKQIRIQKLERV